MDNEVFLIKFITYAVGNLHSPQSIIDWEKPKIINVS